MGAVRSEECGWGSRGMGLSEGGFADFVKRVDGGGQRAA